MLKLNVLNAAVREIPALYGSAWGGFALAGGAAALAAPAIFQNDDRGYFKTALVTTPVIGAGLAALPSMWDGFKAAGTTLKANAAAARVTLGPNSLKNMNLLKLREMRRNGSLSPESWVALRSEFMAAQNEAALAYFSGAPMRRALDVQGGYQKSLDRLYILRDKIKKGALLEDQVAENLTYALHEAGLKSSTAAQRMEDQDKFYFPTKPKTMAEIEAALDAGKNLAPEQADAFYRVMSRRLGAAAREEAANPLNWTSNMFPSKSWNAFSVRNNDEAMRVLKGMNKGHLGTALQNALQKSWLDDAKLVYENDQAIGFQLIKGKEKLTFGFLDKETGSMRFGEQLQHIGAARKVFNPNLKDKISELDEHLIASLDPQNYDQFSDLQKELDSKLIYSGRDPDDFWAAENLQGADADTAVLSPNANRWRNQEVGYSGLKQFGGRRAKELSYEERTALLRENEGILTKLGSDASLKKMVFNLLGQERVITGQLPLLDKNNWLARSLTKPMQLDLSTIPEDARAAFVSEYAENLNAGELQMGRLHVAGVTPQQKTLFGYLPAPVTKEIEGKTFYSTEGIFTDEVRQDAIRLIEQDMQFSASLANKEMRPAEETRMIASATWQSLEKMFADPQVLMSARKLGSLEEGEYLLSSQFAGYGTKEGASVKVKALRLSEEMAKGEHLVHPEYVVGYGETGEQIKLTGEQNRVTSVTYDGNDYVISYERLNKLHTGSKIDVVGRKGLAILNQESDMENQRMVLNQLYARSFRGTPISEQVTAFANIMTFHAKRDQEAFHAAVSDAATLIEHAMNPGGQADSSMDLQPFLDRLANQGITFHPDYKGFSEKSDLGDIDKGARVLDVNQTLSDLSQHIESRLAGSAAHQKDSFFGSYLTMKRAGTMDSLKKYTELFAATSDFTAWDSSRNALGSQIRMTFDMESQLYRNKEYEVLKELQSKAIPAYGDTRQALAFWEHFGTGNFKKQLGESMPVDKVGLPAGRGASPAATVFDPDNPDFFENFSIDLGKDRDVVMGGQRQSMRYLPVLGTKAYKGSGNAYGAGEMALTKYQHSLADLVSSAQNQEDDGIFAQNFQRYSEALVEMLHGKGGMVRPLKTHPDAVALAIQTRPSMERIGPGMRNPFEVVIGKDSLHMIEDETLRKSLAAGETGYAAVARHPVSDMPLVRVRMATEHDYLDKGLVGIDAGLRSLLQADSDKDVLNLFFLTGQEAKDAAQKAIAYNSDFSKMSEQWRSLRTVDMLQGNLENSAKMMAEKSAETVGSKYLENQLAKIAGSAGSRAKNIQARMAHETTGLYSNLLSQLSFSMDIHPTLAFSPDRNLTEKLFWLTRQVPISAGKGSTSFAGSKNPTDLYEEFMAGLRGSGPDSVRLAQDAMTKIAIGANFETVLRDKEEVEFAKNYFGITQKTAIKDGVALKDAAGKLMQEKALEPGVRLNLAAETMLSGRGGALVKEFIENRDRAVDSVMTGLTSGNMTVEQAVTHVNNLKAKAVIPYLKASNMGSSGRMAEETASMLGEINSALSRGSRTVSEVASGFAGAARKAAPILAAGAVVAGVAGVLTTSLKRGNPRPEETQGVQDEIPGSGMEGEMSSQPPARPRPAPAQVRTAVVAPMSRTHQVEVQAIARNRDGAAEISRIVQQNVPGGGGSVTVNYQGGARDRMSKMRMREQLRDSIYSQPVY